MRFFIAGIMQGSRRDNGLHTQDYRARLNSLLQQHRHALTYTAQCYGFRLEYRQFDGTVWLDDEMVSQKLGAKTGARMGHMSMAGEAGSMAAFAALDVDRKVFIHINNSNHVLIEGSPERQQANVAGWEIAYDGMAIEL